MDDHALRVARAECDKAFGCLRRARAELPPMEFGESEVACAYHTARGAVILAMAYISECREQWSKQE